MRQSKRAKIVQPKVIEVDQGGTARVKKDETILVRSGKYPISATRIGKKSAVVYLAPSIKRKLKELSLERETSIQDLMEEAVLEFLEKNDKVTRKK